jgi:uncharacterized protein (TIGR02001 family)
MSIKKITTVAAGVLMFGFLTPIGSYAAEKTKFSANVGLVSEYYFRGISQNDDAPALQGGFDYEVSASKDLTVYAGIWGSSVDFNEGAGGASLEADYYAGIRTTLGSGVSLDTGLIYYTYPGAASSSNYDFWEAQAALGYDFGAAALTVSVNYSPENFGKSGKAVYYKAAVDVPVKDITLSAYVARQNVDDNDAFANPDYTEYNLSAGTSMKGFDVAVAYSDTNISPEADGTGKALIFSVSRAF